MTHTHGVNQKLPRWIGASLFILLGSIAAQAAIIPPTHFAASSRIRVRLAESEPAVSIRGYDLKIQDGTEATPTQSSGRTLSKLADISEWSLRCHGDRVRALIPKSGQLLELHSPVIVSSPAGMIRFHSRPYRDEIRVYAKGSRCEVINELDIEKYLTGIVNAEFSSQWNEEAVKAQVIAARTYAYFQLKSVRSHTPFSHYDVDASVKDQVYDGYGSEDFRGSRAVEKTRGIVLMVSNPGSPGQLEPLKAFYHSSCAGTTELPENVWGSHFTGFNQSVSCPFCKQSDKVAWNMDLGKIEVQKAIIKGAQSQGAPKGWPKGWREILAQGELQDLRAGNVDRAHHRLEIGTVWSWRGSRYELPMSGVRFRDWIGTSRLKSTVFDLARSGSDTWHFVGRGNGHGVGMCQLGAKFLGETGFKTASILKHYYPDAVMAKMW